MLAAAHPNANIMIVSPFMFSTIRKDTVTVFTFMSKIYDYKSAARPVFSTSST